MTTLSKFSKYDFASHVVGTIPKIMQGHISLDDLITHQVLPVDISVLVAILF